MKQIINIFCLIGKRVKIEIYHMDNNLIFTLIYIDNAPTTARNYMTRRISIYDNNGIKKIIHLFSYIENNSLIPNFQKK